MSGRPLAPLLQNLLLSVASATVFLGAAEGIGRLVERGRREPPIADNIADWSGWDGDFFTAKGWSAAGEFNGEGLRDRQHAVAKPAGVRRLVVLGDSTTYGQHLEARQAYPQVLQEQLDARGQGVEVFSVALPGWSARQQLIAYRRICRQYAPDQVILALCLNDVADTQNNLSRPPAVLAALYRRSALVRLAVDAEGRQIRDVRELFEVEGSSRVREGYEKLFAEIRSLRDEVRGDGASFAIVVFPFRFQVARDAPPPRAQTRIAAFCETEGIRVVDMLPAFREAGPAAFVDEDHFTEMGMRLAADRLLASGLIEGGRPRPELPRDVASLVRLLGDRDEDVRLRASDALVAIRPDAAVFLPEVVQILDDEDGPGRAAAARVLGAMGPAARDAVHALVRALRDRREEVRAQAATALGEIEESARSAVPALIEAMKDREIRWRAADALGRIGPEAAAAVPALTIAVGDESGDVRRLSVRALGRIGPPAGSAAGVLIAALADPRPDVRLAAARALARVDPDLSSAMPALTRALEDPDPGVRQEAAAALRKLRRIGRRSGV